LSLGLSLSLGMALFDRRNRRERFLLVGGSAILLYAIFLTAARAALFSLVAIFLTLGSLKGRRTLLAMLLLLLLVMAIPNPITERLFAGRKLDIYALERVNIWKQSLRVGLERPLSGVGFGNFEFFSRRFNFPVEEAVGRYAKIPEMAHNQYLELFAEVGILGLVALFYCLSLLFKSLPRLLPLTSGVEKGFLAGIVAFLVHSLFDNALYLPASSMLVSLCFGFLASKTSFGEVRRYLARRAVPVLLISVLGLACLSFLLRPVLSFRLYKKCKEYAQALDYRRAIERCEQASLLSPGCAVYYDALGKLYSARFGESQALSDLWLAYRRFQSALETNPVDSKLQEDFADFLVANAEHISSEEGDKALEVVRLLKRAVELDPYNPFIRGKLSSVYLELGRLEEARDELLEILELEPNFVRAYYQLGVVYGRMGDLEKSEIYLKRALSFKESNLKGRARSGYEEKLLEFDYRLVDKGQEN